MKMKIYPKNEEYNITSESLQLGAALDQKLFGLLLQLVRSPLRQQHRLSRIAHQPLHLAVLILHPLVKLLRTEKHVAFLIRQVETLS